MPRRPRPLLLNGNYMRLWNGQAISSMGTQASNLAFPLLVVALTSLLLQAGFIGGMRALPYLLLSLPPVALVDRWNRKAVMMLCDADRALGRTVPHHASWFRGMRAARSPTSSRLPACVASTVSPTG